MWSSQYRVMLVSAHVSRWSTVITRVYWNPHAFHWLSRLESKAKNSLVISLGSLSNHLHHWTMVSFMIYERQHLQCHSWHPSGLPIEDSFLFSRSDIDNNGHKITQLRNKIMTYENETWSSGFRFLLYFLQMTCNLHTTACLCKNTVHVTCSF